MASKTVLTVAQLLDLLAKRALSPAEVVELTDVSLATANRKFKEALHVGLVVKVGKGPAMRYRASTPQEQLQVLKPEVVSVLPSGEKVFMELVTDSARVLAKGLKKIAEPGSAAALTSADLSKLDEIKCALEHRLAWDESLRTSSTGALGTAPVELLANVKVSSGEHPLGLMDLLDRLPEGCFLGRSQEGFIVMSTGPGGVARKVAEAASPQDVIIKASRERT